MRVDVLRGAQLVPSTRAEIARFRHRIFVQRLGWEMKDSSVYKADRREGEESDEYDHDDTVYVTLRGNEDAIVGCVRLLPATHRYLLRDHFRHLVDDLSAAVDVDGMDSTSDLPGDDCGSSAVVSRVWELSRFAWDSPKTGETQEALETQRSASMLGTRELLRAAVFTARALGARRLIGVTFVSLARLFVRLGVPTHKLGAAYRIDGRWVAAYRIDLDTQTLVALGLITEVTAAQPAAPWGAPCEAADVILPREATTAT